MNDYYRPNFDWILDYWSLQQLNPSDVFQKYAALEKEVIKIGINCIDERIDPFLGDLVFRTPGAGIFPREDEPAYTLAALLFFILVAGEFKPVTVEIADHGQLTDEGYTGCGMDGVSKTISHIQELVAKNSSLSEGEITSYLNRLFLYDLAKVGGIGQHAQWEARQLRKLQAICQFEVRAGRIKLNSSEREKIPNQRLIITQPYINQNGLLANQDEQGDVFDGSTIIQTITGIPDIARDYIQTNGLFIFGYEKGENIKEILILEPKIKPYYLSKIRPVLSKIGNMVNTSLKVFSTKIQKVVNLSLEDCQNYLQSIKETIYIDLYALDSDRLKQARKIAESIKQLQILPEGISIKYGLVDFQGEIIEDTITKL